MSDSYTGYDSEYEDAEEGEEELQNHETSDDDSQLSDVDDAADPALVDDYQIFSLDDMTSEMRLVSDTLSDVIGVSSSTIRLLLREYKWEKEKLLQKFYECAEPSYFFATSPTQMDILTRPSVEQQYIGECDICCDEGPLSGLKCGHLACSVCWNSYLNSKIRDEGIFDVRCIDGSCNISMNDEQVLFYVLDDDTKLCYQRLLVNDFVDANRLLKWCPGTGCGRVIKLQDRQGHSVYCDCGCCFCSACPEDAHMPMPCTLLKAWFTKQKEDGSTMKWLTSNTRPCPSCQSPIEKNGGCNYMQCTQPSCRSFFCWSCMKKMESNHQPHNCHVYVEGDDAARNSVFKDLERLNHYMTRFNIHKGSLDLEIALSRRTAPLKAKHRRMHGSDMQITFLDESLSILTKARRVVMFTNPFAFFLKDEMQRAILEDNQKDLEVATEELSFIIEQEVILNDSKVFLENIKQIGAKIRDKMIYVDRRRKVLLNHCEECVEEGKVN